MTRSLGDTSVKDRGVIAEPEVHRWSLKERAGSWLLLASDGIWEFLSAKEAAHLVLDAMASKKNSKSALEVLLKKARELWHAEEENYCDDIVAILVPVDAPPAPHL